MSTTFLGAGICPCGVSPAGYGQVATSDKRIKSLYKDANGVQQNSRYISPETGDYVVDDNGYFLGMGSIQQQVLLAIKTFRGSSVLNTLGQGFSNVQVIGSKVKELITNEINLAFQSLVDNKKITIDSIDILTNANKCSIVIKWIDLTTNTINSNTI
jgi:hypothetical protein